MSEINLLRTDTAPSHGDYSSVARLLARLLKFLLIIAVVIYIALFAYGWFNDRKLDSLLNSIKLSQAEALNNQDRNELVTRQEQLAELETLINDHVYWSYLLPELARVTLQSARYAEIEASKDGNLNLTVNLPNYEEIEKYMQIFDLPEYNQQFSNVQIIGINTVQTESSIQTQLRLRLTFNPEYIKGRM